MIRAWQVLLNGGAVLGAVCVLAALSAVVLDVRPMVFRSGSMSPTIDTGALALVHRIEASDLAVGDVVGVTAASGSRVTHRIVELHRDGDLATLRLRGDANDTVDPQPYQVADADRVIAAVPRLGYVVGLLTGNTGRLILGLYGAFLLTLLLRPQGQRDARAAPAPGRRRAPKPRARARVLTVTALVALCGSLTVARAAPGWAAWTDQVAVTGSDLSTHAVMPPTSVGCDGGGLLAPLTYSWPSKDARYTYRVQLVNSTGTILQTDEIPESGPTNYSITYTAANLPTGNFTVRVSSFLTGSTAWTSTTATQRSGSKLSVLFVGLVTACG